MFVRLLLLVFNFMLYSYIVQTSIHIVIKGNKSPPSIPKIVPLLLLIQVIFYAAVLLDSLVYGQDCLDRSIGRSTRSVMYPARHNTAQNIICLTSKDHLKNKITTRSNISLKWSILFLPRLLRLHHHHRHRHRHRHHRNSQPPLR